MGRDTEEGRKGPQGEGEPDKTTQVHASGATLGLQSGPGGTKIPLGLRNRSQILPGEGRGSSEQSECRQKAEEVSGQTFD